MDINSKIRAYSVRNPASLAVIDSIAPEKNAAQGQQDFINGVMQKMTDQSKAR